MGSATESIEAAASDIQGNTNEFIAIATTTSATADTVAAASQEAAAAAEEIGATAHELSATAGVLEAAIARFTSRGSELPG